MPSTKRTTIISRVRRAVAPPDGKGVGIDDPIEDHIYHPIPKAYAGMLNRRQGFKKDGLNLRSADTKKAKIIRDLVLIVIAWYKKNGWAVT